MLAYRDYNAAVDFLDRNVAEGRGEKIAFIDPRRSLTYKQLRDAASRVSTALARLRLEPENRIALVLNDSVEFPMLFWGAIRAGIIPVPMNTLLTADQYRYLFEDSRAKFVFVSASLVPKVEEAARDLPWLRGVVSVEEGTEAECEISGTVVQLERLLEAEADGMAPARTSADEAAYWLYSSGTTGPPKAVMLPHCTPIEVASLAGRRRLGIKEDDVVFSAAKAFFSYGLGNSLFFPMSVGATAVLCPDRPTPSRVFQMLKQFEPTVFFGVPTLYASLLASSECKKESLPSRMHLCVSAGEALPPHVGEEWTERFGLSIVNGVGSTEVGHLYLTNLPDAVEYGTSGVPVDGHDLKLVDEDGREVGENKLGELMVRGSCSGIGYWNQREKSRSTFLGAWTRTGDRYVRRDDGVYIYSGRTDEMFKVSGAWVSPLEIENALLSHPSVLEAAVVPWTDEHGLIKPKAFVVLKDQSEDLDEATHFDELKAHVKSTIGPWKYPRWIEFVSDLPKTATGKIQRYVLRNASEFDDHPVQRDGVGL